MTGPSDLPSRIERGDLFFTASPGAVTDLPLPFRVAGRLPRLLDVEAPSVAVLGFGLGAVSDLMLAGRPLLRLVGVEPDRELVAAIPERLRERVSIRAVDALGFLRRARDRFDLIFDDCFELRGEEAVRPPELTQHAGLVARRLGPRGVYVRNLLPGRDSTIEEQTADLRRRFEHVALRRFRDWENVFAVACRRELPDDWRARLR